MATDQSTVALVEYRDIAGFPGYRVGDDGSIWTCWKSVGPGPYAIGTVWRRMKGSRDRTGHRQVGLRRDRRYHYRYVHRLVLEAFVGPCPPGMEACHYPDPDPANNRLDNLRWDTHKANQAHRIEQGTALRGERATNVKLTEADVLAIRAEYATGKATHAVLAARYHICSAHVGDIVNRKRWQHI